MTYGAPGEPCGGAPWAKMEGAASDKRTAESWIFKVPSEIAKILVLDWKGCKRATRQAAGSVRTWPAIARFQAKLKLTAASKRNGPTQENGGDASGTPAWV